MTPFVIYQGAWNVMERSFEREIIPMARSEGNFNFYHVNFEDKNYLMLKKKSRHGSRSLECPRRW